MKFLVIEGPSEWATELFFKSPTAAEATGKGLEYYSRLEAQGKLEHYVRLDGPPGGVLIFDVDSAEEFAQLRAEDPMAPLLGNNIKVIPLASPRAAMHLMRQRSGQAAQQGPGEYPAEVP